MFRPCSVSLGPLGLKPSRRDLNQCTDMRRQCCKQRLLVLCHDAGTAGGSPTHAAALASRIVFLKGFLFFFLKGRGPGCLLMPLGLPTSGSGKGPPVRKASATRQVQGFSRHRQDPEAEAPQAALGRPLAPCTCPLLPNGLWDEEWGSDELPAGTPRSPTRRSHSGGDL